MSLSVTSVTLRLEMGGLKTKMSQKNYEPSIQYQITERGEGVGYCYKGSHKDPRSIVVSYSQCLLQIWDDSDVQDHTMLMP